MDYSTSHFLTVFHLYEVICAINGLTFSIYFVSAASY